MFRWHRPHLKLAVALRKESVDRNEPVGEITLDGLKSLSARRAWIEMSIKPFPISKGSRSLSARRAWIEMVYLALIRYLIKSLSARRAWIEISRCSQT